MAPKRIIIKQAKINKMDTKKTVSTKCSSRPIHEMPCELIKNKTLPKKSSEEDSKLKKIAKWFLRIIVIYILLLLLKELLMAFIDIEMLVLAIELEKHLKEIYFIL